MSLPRHARVAEPARTGARLRGGSSRVGRGVALLAAALAVTGVQVVGGSAAPATAATTRPAATAGADAVGTASYPVPAGAVFVSTAGSDTSTGTVGAPVRTITRALAIAAAGDTIVIRGGVYHESVTVNKTVTIQNYPGEAVWLDGAERVTGWEPAGTVWRKAGWDHVFDHSPTTTFGASDGTTANWTFLNPAHPMAAHPDQLWINGAEMTQVDALAKVGTGTFFYDESNHALYVGTDPTNKTAEASSLQKVFSVRAANTVIRGLGIRRYAPSVPHQGALTLEKPGIVLDNDTIVKTATAGIALTSSDITVRNTTIDGSGLMGLRGRLADRAKLLSVRITNNNDQHFNYSPAAGGIKVTRTMGITVRDSLFSSNWGKGLWLDQSVSDSDIVGNDFLSNKQNGISLELSATSMVADNRFLDNASDAIKINNTQDVQIWNNTFRGNARPYWIVQDARHAADPEDSYDLDPRRPVPDPRMTWYVGPVTVANNVIVQLKGTACMLCVEDPTHERTAEQIGVHADGNVYNRVTATSNWAVVWAKGIGSPATFSSINAFRTATGQDARSLVTDGTSVLNTAGDLAASVTDQAATVATALPANVATMIGQDEGVQHLGAFGSTATTTAPVSTTSTTTAPAPTTAPTTTTAAPTTTTAAPTTAPAPTTTTATPEPIAAEPTTSTPVAPARQVVAADEFSRQLTGGFGTAAQGGAWSVVGRTAPLSVANGRGNIALTSTTTPPGVFLPSTKSTDTDVVTRFGLSKLPTGTASRVDQSVVVRRVGTAGDYRATLRVDAAGKVQLFLVRVDSQGSYTTLASKTISTVYKPGATWNVRVRAFGLNGTALRAKVWAGSTEPIGWQASATDSTKALQAAGDAGFRARVVSSPTAVTAFYDSLRVSHQTAS